MMMTAFHIKYQKLCLSSFLFNFKQPGRHQMKNSSSVSSALVPDDSSKAADLLSTRGRLGGPHPTAAATVLPLGAPQVLQRLRVSVWACLRHSISSLATPPTAAGLCGVTRGSAEEERAVALSAAWPTGWPVSTFVSSSCSSCSSSSSSRRWDKERLMGGRRGDRGAGLLRSDE